MCLRLPQLPSLFVFLHLRPPVPLLVSFLLFRHAILRVALTLGGTSTQGQKGHMGFCCCQEPPRRRGRQLQLQTGEDSTSDVTTNEGRGSRSARSLPSTRSSPVASSVPPVEAPSQLRSPETQHLIGTVVSPLTLISPASPPVEPWPHARRLGRDDDTASLGPSEGLQSKLGIASPVAAIAATVAASRTPPEVKGSAPVTPHKGAGKGPVGSSGGSGAARQAKYSLLTAAEHERYIREWGTAHFRRCLCGNRNVLFSRQRPL
jgi:hypothetical protein